MRRAHPVVLALVAAPAPAAVLELSPGGKTVVRAGAEELGAAAPGGAKPLPADGRAAQAVREVMLRSVLDARFVVYHVVRRRVRVALGGAAGVDACFDHDLDFASVAQLEEPLGGPSGVMR